MPGRIVDLSIPGARFPDPVIVDANLIVERLLAPFIAVLPAPAAASAQRASQFFHDLAVNGGTGIVTPTAFVEFVHVAIRFKYQQEQLRLGQPRHQWRQLYKQDATILQAFQGDLEQLRRLLIANGLLFVSPDELDPIRSGRSYDEELVHLVGGYGLDSSDAAILMDAQRLGVPAVVSLDADMRRAQADFDVYTWL